jgi:hypothetical protein
VTSKQGCLECERTAAYAALLDEAPPEVDPRGNKLTRWQGYIAPYEEPTGDKRTFAADSLESRPLPLALKWQRVDGKGHEGSVSVGTMEGVEYRPDGVWAWGILLDPDPAVMPRLAEDVAEAKLLMSKKIIGPSVDLAKMEFQAIQPDEFAEMGDGRPDIRVTSGQFGAATLVPIPAFANLASQFSLDEISVDDYESLVASVREEIPVRTDWSDVPVAFVDWDPHAFLAVEAADETLVAGAFLYEGEQGSLFPVAETVGGQLSVIPDAVAAAIAVFAAHEEQIPLDARTVGAMKTALVDLAERCELPPPPWTPAALVASGAPLKPPREWFETPEASKPTPLTVTEDGRVYGHIADWRTCHTGYPGTCVTAPRSASGYAYAHTGAVLTEEGDQIQVGRLTVGGGHAPTRPGVGFRAALEHYDNASTTAAIGRFRDGKHGIWFSGAVVPEATPQQLAQLRRHPPSGDWRTIGGTKEMILAHSVNAPGFPVVSAGVERGELTSLVAAGALLGDEMDVDYSEAPEDHDGRAEAALAVFGLDRHGHAHGKDGKFAPKGGGLADRAKAAAGIFKKKPKEHPETTAARERMQRDDRAGHVDPEDHISNSRHRPSVDEQDDAHDPERERLRDLQDKEDDLTPAERAEMARLLKRRADRMNAAGRAGSKRMQHEPDFAARTTAALSVFKR